MSRLLASTTAAALLSLPILAQERPSGAQLSAGPTSNGARAGLTTVPRNRPFRVQRTSQSQPATCDGSIRSAESRRSLGKLVSYLGIGAATAGAVPIWPKTENTAFGVGEGTGMNTPLIVAGVAATVVGAYWSIGKKSDETAWENALRSLPMGIAKSADAIRCLGNPSSSTRSTTADGEQHVLTYRTKIAGVDHIYTLTFAKDALAKIDRSAVGQ